MKAAILKILGRPAIMYQGRKSVRNSEVSRTAVWKVIRQLQEEGYQVDAARSRGYRIIDGPDVMTAEEVESLLDYGMGRKAGCLLSGDGLYKYQNQTSGR